MCLRRNSMASYWNYSKTFSNFVSAWIQLKPNKKSFYDVFELSPSPITFAWYQKICKAFPKCVLGEIQWHTIEIILRHFPVLSQPKFSWNLLKNLSKTFSNCIIAQILSAWYQKCCKAFPKCVLGKSQWHPIEIFLRNFQILSQPNLSWNLINFSKTFSKFLLAQTHLHGTQKFVTHFQNLS